MNLLLTGLAGIVPGIALGAVLYHYIAGMKKSSVGTNPIPPHLGDEHHTDLCESIGETGTWIYDITKHIFYGSPELKRLMGLPPDGPLPTLSEWLHLVQKSDRSHVAKNYYAMINKEREEVDLEYRIQPGHGKERWHRVRARYISRNGLPCIVGTAQDTTDIKQHQIFVNTLEENILKAQEVANFGIWVSDLEAGQLVASDTCYRICGLDPDTTEFNVENAYDFIYPDDRPRILERIENPTENVLSGLELRVLLPDGGYRWVLLHTAPLLNEKNIPVRIIGVVIDIHDRKIGEYLLKKSEERLELALRASGMTVWDWDLILDRARVQEYSEESKAMIVETIDDPRAAWTPLIHPDHKETIYNKLKDIIDGKIEGAPIEFQEFSSSGALRWVQVNARATATGDDGTATRIVATRINITDRKNEEERLRKLELGVQHAQKLESLGVLAGGIAHDFNNFLTSILGNSELAMARLKENQDVQKNLDIIVTTSKRAADLCQQMLAYSGKGRFVIEPVALNSITKDLSQLLDASISKKVTLKQVCKEKVPLIQGDSTQLRQVIMNLIINASEACGEEPGEITLTTGCKYFSDKELKQMNFENTPSQGDYVYMSINDTGCGMAPKTLQAIYEPFYTTKFTGRGLGLSAVLGIIHSHQAAIAVESAQGQGSTFTLLFKPEMSPPHAIDPAENDDEVWHGSGVVLLVDDEQAILDITSQMLRDFGFSVCTAHDGIEAIELFKKHQSSIVVALIDVTMPRMGGAGSPSGIAQNRSGTPHDLVQWLCGCRC